MLKVLYLINNPVPYGANVALHKTLSGLLRKGVKPLVVMRKYGKVCEWLEEAGIEYKIIPHYFALYPPAKRIYDYFLFIPRILRMFVFNNLAKSKLERLVLDFEPDIIHTNVGPIHLGLEVAKKMNVKHVWHVREYQGWDLYMSAFPSQTSFEKKLNDPYNHNIAITNDIFRYYNMSKDNSTVIYDGVLLKDQVQFLKQKKKYFLFVGRLEEAKGIHFLLETFIEFSQNNKEYKLLIAGTGQEHYCSILHKMVAKAGLENQVEFLGFRTDVCNLMAEASALIVPSRSEGFGFITVEAMFNGCLVFGYNSGGTKEILKDNCEGWLFSNKDELLKLMTELAANGVEHYYPQLLVAQEQAVNMYSQEKNVEKVYNYYNQILNTTVSL